MHLYFFPISFSCNCLKDCIMYQYHIYTCIYINLIGCWFMSTLVYIRSSMHYPFMKLTRASRSICSCSNMATLSCSPTRLRSFSRVVSSSSSSSVSAAMESWKACVQIYTILLFMYSNSCYYPNQNENIFHSILQHANFYIMQATFVNIKKE